MTYFFPFGTPFVVESASFADLSVTASYAFTALTSSNAVSVEYLQPGDTTLCTCPAGYIPCPGLTVPGYALVCLEIKTCGGGETVACPESIPVPTTTTTSTTSTTTTSTTTTSTTTEAPTTTTTSTTTEAPTTTTLSPTCPTIICAVDGDCAPCNYCCDGACQNTPCPTTTTTEPPVTTTTTTTTSTSTTTTIYCVALYEVAGPEASSNNACATSIIPFQTYTDGPTVYEDSVCTNTLDAGYYKRTSDDFWIQVNSSGVIVDGPTSCNITTTTTSSPTCPTEICLTNEECSPCNYCCDGGCSSTPCPTTTTTTSTTTTAAPTTTTTSTTTTAAPTTTTTTTCVEDGSCTCYDYQHTSGTCSITYDLCGFGSTTMNITNDDAGNTFSVCVGTGGITSDSCGFVGNGCGCKCTGCTYGNDCNTTTTTTLAPTTSTTTTEGPTTTTTTLANNCGTVNCTGLTPVCCQDNGDYCCSSGSSCNNGVCGEPQ